MTATGWTWDQVREQLDLPRLTALSKTWKVTPPSALQLARIAAFLGLKPEPVAPDEQVGAADDLSADVGAVATAPRPTILTPDQFINLGR